MPPIPGVPKYVSRKGDLIMPNPYEEAHALSINDPASFWQKAAEDCHWYKKWDTVLDDSRRVDVFL